MWTLPSGTWFFFAYRFATIPVFEFRNNNTYVTENFFMPAKIVLPIDIKKYDDDRFTAELRVAGDTPNKNPHWMHEKTRRKKWGQSKYSNCR